MYDERFFYRMLQFILKLFNVDLVCYFIHSTDRPMVDDLRKLCLSKDDFIVLNTIGRGHFGQVKILNCHLYEQT